MKWSGWIVFSLAAALAVAMNAAEPRLTPPRLAKVSVNSARLATDDVKEAPPAAAAQPAAVTPHAPVHFRQASWNIWSGTATGYVYAPGACDYTPPCVNQLWDGYVQRPHRCDGIHMHGGCRGAQGCGGCGGCGSASSCGGGGHCSLKRAHGWHFGGKVYGGCSSCSDIAPSCAAPSCAAPSCGCEAIGGKGSYDVGPAPPAAPPAPMPTADDGEAPKAEAPKEEAPAPDPALDEASRGQRLRGFTWPENSLQR